MEMARIHVQICLRFQYEPSANVDTADDFVSEVEA